jgi:tetratricopeptide (TPR) repeat protein
MDSSGQKRRLAIGLAAKRWKARAETRWEAQAEKVRLAEWATRALAEGRSAEVEVKARSAMAAHADAGLTAEPYLTAWQCLAVALGQLGHHAAAVDEFTRLIDAGSATRPKDPRVITWQAGRGGQLACLGRYDEAEADCRVAIESCRRLGPWDSQAAVVRSAAINNLLVVLNGRGLHAEAEAEARRAIRDTDSSAVPARFLVGLRCSLGASLNAQGRYDEAKHLLQGLQPEDATVKVSVLTNLAAARLGLGDAENAEVGAREAVKQGQQHLGPVHILTLTAGTQLGKALAWQGRLDEALQQLHANAAAWAEHFGEEHPKTIAARSELARIGSPVCKKRPEAP